METTGSLVNLRPITPLSRDALSEVVTASCVQKRERERLCMSMCVYARAFTRVRPVDDARGTTGMS